MIKQYGYFSRSKGVQVESPVLFYWCCQGKKLQNTNKLNKTKLKMANFADTASHPPWQFAVSGMQFWWS
jgi:hypothetical protein